MSNRAIVVVDRGWVYAGDVKDVQEPHGWRIKLTNAVWVFRWRSVGFAAVIDDYTLADIRPVADLDIPAASEIFRVPVPAGWGGR